MIILRGTQKFLSLAGIRPETEPAAESQSSSSQWYVNVFYVDRAKCLIFVHSLTLFSFIVTKITKKDLADLEKLFRKELSRAMFHMKCPGEMITKVLQECDGIKVFKTTNRSVLSSMNDLVYHAKYYLYSHDDAIRALCKINLMPMGALKYKDPIEEFSRLHGFPVNINSEEIFKGLDSEEGLEDFLKQELGPDIASDLAGATPLRIAQELVYEAWERSDLNEAIRLAHKAILISPQCADAYNLLAEEAARDARQAAGLYSQAVNAGRLALGEDFFRDNEGHFWGMMKTRPYMRALAGLQEAFWDMGKFDEAIRICHEMLRLNPNDNQGMRYIVIRYLAKLSRHDELEKFMEKGAYPNDCAAEWCFTRALFWFIKEGDTDRSCLMIKKALRSNKFVPVYLKKKSFRLKELPDRLTVGGEDEAQYYAHEYGDVWRSVSGAINWLVKYIGLESASPC